MILTLDASILVTPLAGVWIEIHPRVRNLPDGAVTPLAGVWIEIPFLLNPNPAIIVTPLAGVWIEILPRHLSGPV